MGGRVNRVGGRGWRALPKPRSHLRFTRPVPIPPKQTPTMRNRDMTAKNSNQPKGRAKLPITYVPFKVPNR